MTAQELKNSILQYAVQGKLVPQNPNDEPAELLLQKIKAEKQQLVKEKKIKADKPLAPISEDEIPFEIPESWVWVRLGEICNFGKNESVLSNKIKDSEWLLELEDIEKESGRIIDFKLKKDRNSVSNKNVFKKGNVLYSKLRPYLNKVVIVDNDGYCSSEIFPLDFGGHIYNKFAKTYLMSPEFVEYATQKSYGTKMPRFGSTDGQNALFSLPPLTEQHRIVQKIEELMPLVEAYDKAEKELTELNTKFPEQIKKSVLQYAIQGKLVPQNPHDEPASELLKRIKAEKQQLIREKKIKASKLLAPISDEEIPFEIPESWEWVRLGELLTVHGGKRIPKGFDWTGNPTKHIYIRVTDMKNNTILSDKLKYISDEVYEQIKKYIISKDDLYLTIAGTIGSVGSVPEMFDGMNLTENAVKLSNIQVDKNFLLKVIASEFVQNQFVDKTNKVAQPKLAIERVLTTIIPLPPLAEQQRIVEKVEEVLRVCEKLR